jgi:UPF0716 protein FxsA
VRWVILAALAFPLADFAALVALGARFGGLFAFGYALLGVVAGLQLTRCEGGRVWSRTQSALARGEAPGEGAIAGIAILAGGLLLALPGPLSDLLGLALFVAPARRALASWVARRFSTSVVAGAPFGMPRGGMPFGGVPFGAARGADPRTSSAQRGPAHATRGVYGRPGARGRGRPGGGVIIETEGEVIDDAARAPRGDAPLPGGH